MQSLYTTTQLESRSLSLGSWDTGVMNTHQHYEYEFWSHELISIMNIHFRVLASFTGLNSLMHGLHIIFN